MAGRKVAPVAAFGYGTDTKVPVPVSTSTVYPVDVKVSRALVLLAPLKRSTPAVGVEPSALTVSGVWVVIVT